MPRDERRMLEELATRLFSDHEARAEDAGRLDEQLWRAFTSSGLDRVLTSDESGESIGDAAIVCKIAGRFSARIPVVEPIVAQYLAFRAGWQEQSRMPTVASLLDMGSVPWGRDASVVYGLTGGTIWRTTGVVRMTALAENIAGEPRDSWHTPRHLESAETTICADEVLALSALLRAAMMAGAMRRCVEIVLAHARDRVQFGRPIVQFQAVQQMLAQLRAQVAAADAAVDFCATERSKLSAAVAKSRTSEAVRRLVDCAHEIAGAMGYSMEFPLQQLTRRLWAWRDEDGSEVHWNCVLGDELARRGSDSAWGFLSSPLASARFP